VRCSYASRMKQSPTNGVQGLSRVFHLLDDLTTRAATSGVVLVGVLVAVVAIGVFGVSSDVQYAFATAASAITLILVFVIQHTPRVGNSWRSRSSSMSSYTVPEI
jgi:low affinity Fe/Cu permease